MINIIINTGNMVIEKDVNKESKDKSIINRFIEIIVGIIMICLQYNDLF